MHNVRWLERCATVFTQLIVWTAFLNLVETALNVRCRTLENRGVNPYAQLYYVYLANVLGSPSAPVIGFTSIVMTLSKVRDYFVFSHSCIDKLRCWTSQTVLYWLQEYYCGWCSVGHNSLPDLLLLWVLPNGCVRFMLDASFHFHWPNTSYNFFLFFVPSHSFQALAPLSKPYRLEIW